MLSLHNSKKKQHLKAVYRIAAFLLLISSTCVYNVTVNSDARHHLENLFFQVDSHSNSIQNQVFEGVRNESIRRALSESEPSVSKKEEDCENTRKVAGNNFTLVLYIAGVFYMFVAIAIVCDEFFVPTLEEIAGENYLNLSMDVAGATLMAAGGSAPELFTSIIGTFQRSEVGFGTIVGSAVFNVLFVLGVCSMAVKDVLTLTWWPLFRDCVCYAIGLGTLAIFCGLTSPGEIELWEAVIQFLIYIGYVIIMKYNEKIYEKIESRFSPRVETEDSSTSEDRNSQVTRKMTVGSTKTSMFRARLLTVLIGNGSLLEQVGVAMVIKISGDIDTVFKKLDESGDGFIDYDEFERLVTQLSESTATPEEIKKAISDLDDDNDGRINLKEFTKWYITSETRLRKELKKTFDTFDLDSSGTIDKNELQNLMKELGTEVKEEDLNAILYEILMVEDGQSSTQETISFPEFETWYTHSRYWDEHKSKVETCTEDAVENISDHLKPPQEKTVIAYIRWILLFPIVLVLCLTVPDVRQPGRGKLCFLSFIMSVVWIGGFTSIMVYFAEIVGNTLGIPIVLMGLTLLAAGTSVPDLITSAIVARMGEGDMAVSSSIGSNIFDIAVGLPFPWLLFIISMKENVVIKTNGMTTSILILLGMLICIIVMIHCSGWKLTKVVGFGMFILYFAYLAQAVITQLPLKLC